MKHFSCIWLLLCVVTIILDINCMLLVRSTKPRLLLRQQARRHSDQKVLQHRINSLEHPLQAHENEPELHPKELAQIKTIADKLNPTQPLDNSKNISRIDNVQIDQHLQDDSFIDEHNMHYGNR